jgi:hypothetical protein
VVTSPPKRTWGRLAIGRGIGLLTGGCPLARATIESATDGHRSLRAFSREFAIVP